jgi:hypothetical protein
MRSPNARRQRQFLLLLPMLALSVFVVLLFFSEERLPILVPLWGRSVICALCFLFFVIAIWFALKALTERLSYDVLCRLVAGLVTAFLLAQYGFIELYETIGVYKVEPKIITHDKWDALYFSIITWTTTGYGDLVPIGASRLVACCEALLGTLCNGIVLAVVIYQLNEMAKGRDNKTPLP